MKTIIVLFFIAFFSSCALLDSDKSNVTLLHTLEIENIEVIGNNVRATIILSTPTPCYYFFSSEVVKNDSGCLVKVYGYDDEVACVAVMDSIKHTQQIIFLTPGQKRLTFYRAYGEEYLDTIITIK